MAMLDAARNMTGVLIGSKIKTNALSDAILTFLLLSCVYILAMKKAMKGKRGKVIMYWNYIHSHVKVLYCCSYA
jgi:hypothetical protein